MASQASGIRCLQLPRMLSLVLIALALSGCAAQTAFREGRALIEQDRIEAGLAKYQEALAADPGNATYRSAYLRARESNVVRLSERAEAAIAAGQTGQALEDYARVLSIDPENERARNGLRMIEVDAQHDKLLSQASKAWDEQQLELARQRAEAILVERPGHAGARALLNRIDQAGAAAPVVSALSAAYRQPISIEFREAPLKQVFEVISRRSGLNFLFDKDVKADQKVSVFLRDSTVEAALYYLLVTNQLEQQVMDGNTVLVYPNIAAKIKQYKEMTIKTFFLANADAKTVASTLKTILQSRDVVVDEKLNLVILRDSPAAVALAARLIALQDVPEPEVMLEVEILEIKRSRLMELGVSWPASLSLAPLTTAAGGPLTLETLRALRSDNIGVTGLSAKLTANKTDGDSNTLANPRIRVRNKEKASIIIGDKVPSITTTVSPGASGFVSESVNYIDVGLKLSVEPTVYLNNEIAIRISLQVSNLVSSMTTKSGTNAYQIGNREAQTVLQLKDGENQVLAGLISNEDRSSGSKVPGFGSLPILGRLFGTTTDGTDKTEIVLSITPRLVRNIVRPPAAESEFNAGTEMGFQRRPAPQPVSKPAKKP